MDDRQSAINKYKADLAHQNNINILKNNPLYASINEILGDNITYDDAQNAINRAKVNGKIKTPEEMVHMKMFLENNEFLFYDNDLNRIPYSEPGDIVDLNEAIKNFTTEYDKSHSTSQTSQQQKREAMKETTEQSTKEATEQTSRNTTKEAVRESTEETLEQVEKKVTLEGSEKLGKTTAQKIFNKRVGGVLMNSFFAISDYKDARNQGKGVVQAAVKSGGLFVAGEVLQGAMLPVMLAKQAPQMIVNGVEGLQRMTRGMNSMTRFQTFGEAEFHDSPQLATMRQAGMEMAKMSQYNLQQAIMGNEASNMHRI